jgi:hypothetical protein
MLVLDLHLALNETSVTFDAFGLPFPTFSFAFWKSFFFSFLARALLAIGIESKKCKSRTTIGRTPTFWGSDFRATPSDLTGAQNKRRNSRNAISNPVCLKVQPERLSIKI